MLVDRKNKEVNQNSSKHIDDRCYCIDLETLFVTSREKTNKQTNTNVLNIDTSVSSKVIWVIRNCNSAADSCIE